MRESLKFVRRIWQERHLESSSFTVRNWIFFRSSQSQNNFIVPWSWQKVIQATVWITYGQEELSGEILSSVLQWTDASKFKSFFVFDVTKDDTHCPDLL